MIRDQASGPSSSASLPPETGEARLLVAVRGGPVRLLDNARIVLGEPA